MDEEFVRSLERASAKLKASGEEIRKQIGRNASIDAKTKSVLLFLAHVTLNGIASLYDLQAVNTMNRLGRQSKATEVKFTENDYDFIKWEKRYREDQAKDLQAKGLSLQPLHILTSDSRTESKEEAFKKPEMLRLPDWNELPEYGIEALVSTIDDQIDLIAAIRHAARWQEN
jgi:hypothetical protein